ncbi:MAG TPA: acyl-CoA carboxylase subunit beta [Acidobacteriaceae bacterium]|nr:acyl-CoA carboxylase subunit beta [Acidobacteriaceae bacterium]
MADELKAENRLESTVKVGAAKFGENRAAMVALLAALRGEEDGIRMGGGAKAAEAQRAKGRLTVRERLALLLDPEPLETQVSEARPGAPGAVAGSNFLELGLWAAFGMYSEYGGAPGAGVVTGLGRVSGRLCMIVANDATVKAGAFFPMTAKKVLRAQTIALENRIPTLYLVDSSGVFLPLQEDVFPDTDDFGRVFRNNAVMSSLGIPQITAIMGMCVAGGAYLPVMTDTVLMTEGSGLFLAGPSLVQAAIGQKTGAEELGGAAMHAEISGTVDFKEPNDHLCLARLRSLVGMMGQRSPGTHVSEARHGAPGFEVGPFSRVAFDAERDAPRFAAEELYGLLNPAPGASNVYDMREVIARIVDRSEFDEYKADFGRTLLCGFARIGGRAVGIVANQKTNQMQTVAMGPQAGTKRIEVGGVIYTEAAQKAARFIMDCNQNLVPLIFLHDVNGFMVGKDAEWSGIIRAGAKMVSAVSTSVVPKITVIVGGSFGAGHYAMCGKAYDPRFLFAWPTARYAVMSGASAAGTLAEVRAKQMERGGKVLSEAEKKAVYDEIKNAYDAQADPRYGAARLWIDAIIDPAKTREVLMTALEACALNPEVGKFNVGVLQT